MVMHTLPADVIKNPVFRLVPLKKARAVGEGRLVALAPASAPVRSARPPGGGGGGNSQKLSGSPLRIDLRTVRLKNHLFATAGGFSSYLT
jgi:hypothetical protein